MEGVLEKLKDKIDTSSGVFVKALHDICGLEKEPGYKVMMIKGKNMIECANSLE